MNLRDFIIIIRQKKKYIEKEIFQWQHVFWTTEKGIGICLNIVVIISKRWTFMKKTIDQRIGGILTGDEAICFLLLMTFEIS